MKRIPKTPVEFDYDLWTTEDGKCMVRVKITGEVEVDVLHGHHLGVAAPGSAAFDAENRTQGGFPQGYHGFLANLPQAVRQTHSSGGLSLASGGGGDGGNQDQLAVGGLTVLEEPIVHLGLVVAIGLQILFCHTQLTGNVLDGLHLTGLGDLDIASHRKSSPFQNTP